MDYYSGSTILSALFVFTSFLLAFFLLLEKRKSNLFLAGFLLLTALDISVFLYDQFMNLPPVLEILRIRLSAFKNPFLYLYFSSVLFSGFRFTKGDLIHILPFLIPILILSPRFFLEDTEARLYFLSEYHSMIEIQVIRIFENMVTVVYFWGMIKSLRRYKALFLQNTSSAKHTETFTWLTQFLSVILILWTLTFLKELLKLDHDILLVNQFRMLVLFFGLLFITWFTLKALRSPELFRQVDVTMKTTAEILSEKTGTLPSKPDSAEEKITEIKRYMAEEEPFLDPSLTLNDLAIELKTTSRELSLLINQKIGQHFFDFVNAYRIEKAKDLLYHSEKSGVTVQQIMYEVGFNSKSPFNTAFKKHSGMTPTEYRKKLRLSKL